MIIGILTFFIIVAVIGAILYGQRLIKTEKTDAVFGNPEKAKGGAHWVVVGTSFLILSWLYYSWDIAKAFYPKSANELCQVAKVNESLLSLKYLFPIEERSHKSTALIKRENINIQKKIMDINYHFYGSTKYLEKNGYPKSINDLNKHKFISYGKGTPSPVFNPDWVLRLGLKDQKKRKPIMKVNSVYGLLLAVQSGVGLAALPDYITVSVPNIVKVLPQFAGPKSEAHFVYPQSLKNVARVVAFRNFLYSKISKWEF